MGYYVKCGKSKNRKDDIIMTAANIKDYLKMAIDLECSLYTQNRMISSLQKQISNLGYYRRYNEPTFPDFKSDYYGSSSHGTAGLMLAAGIPLVIVAALGWVIILLLRLEVNNPRDYEFFMGIVIIILLPGIALCFAANAINKQIYNELYDEANASYDKSVATYNQLLAADAQRVASENIKKAVLQSDLDALKAANAETQANLKKFYDENILYTKYRNYACVCSLYEYFDSGRCTRLEGHEGAYNILESEMRLNRIITQTNQILSKLDEIKENQELLYDSIQESNRKADKLLASCQDMSNQLVGIQAQGEELNSRIAQLQTTSDLNLYLNACSTLELDSIRRANRIAQ